MADRDLSRYRIMASYALKIIIYFENSTCNIGYKSPQGSYRLQLITYLYIWVSCEGVLAFTVLHTYLPQSETLY